MLGLSCRTFLNRLGVEGDRLSLCPSMSLRLCLCLGLVTGVVLSLRLNDRIWGRFAGIDRLGLGDSLRLGADMRPDS